MGVDKFHSFLRDRNVVRPVPYGLEVVCVAVDIADILHMQARRCSSTQQLVDGTVAQINQFLKVVRLRNIVDGSRGHLSIFFDGPAPLAKLQLQIRRRRTQAARGRNEAASKTSLKKGRKRSRRGKRINPLMLSPGTSLMNELEKGVRKAFPWAYVSGSRESGEGEIKAVHFLLHHQHIFRGQTIVLLGGDSDLVVIGSAARPLTNIICVNTHRNGRGGGRGGRGGRRNHNKSQRKQRQSPYNSVAIQDVWRIAAPLTREDVCIAAIMTGNDYLPRFAGATMSMLLKQASSVNRTGGIVTPDCNLRAAGLLQLVSALDKDRGNLTGPECEILKTETSSIDVSQEKPRVEFCTCCTTVDDKGDESAQNCKMSACDPQLYFAALCWNFSMYNKGYCPNVDFVYKPARAPCISQSRRYLCSLGNDGVIVAPTDPEAHPLSCAAALLLLIPRWGAAEALPPDLVHFIDHPELIHWFPPACSICDDFRQRRAAMQERHSGIISTSFDNDEEEKAAKDAARTERREFQNNYLDHMRGAHPEFEPPVKTIRKLLGDKAMGNRGPRQLVMPQAPGFQQQHQ